MIPSFYNAADQELYKKYQFLPQEQYRLGLNLPTTDAPAPPPVSGGITNTNVFKNSGGGGDGFGVYNADPNTITNMNPNSYALQDARRNNELSYVGRTLPGDSSPLYSTNTEAMKNMEMYPEYYGLDKPPPSKISQLLSKGIGFIPGIGTLSKFGNFAAGLLPANRRAIMENQLGTQGVMVNDIGQIVVGPGGQYNTPEGIMAGYNANKMTDETFTGRQDVMRNTLDQKYGLSKEQIDGLIDGTLTEEEMEDINKQAFNKTLNRPSDIISKIRNTEIARKNFNNTTGKTDEIVNIKTDTKANNNNINNNDGGGGTYIGGGASLEDAGGTYDGGMHGAEGGFENTGGFSPGSQENSPGHPSNRANGGLMYAKGGRAGYFYGGRVSVMKGGLASIL